MGDFQDQDLLMSTLTPSTSASLITGSNDLSLVIDSDGIVRDIAFGSDDTELGHARSWVGEPWIDTVTVESRPKIEALLDSMRTPRLALAPGKSPGSGRDRLADHVQDRRAR